MSVVELPGTGVPGVGVRRSVYGDDFSWCVDESEPRRYNPVTDIRYGPPDDRRYTPEWVEAVVEHASQALSMLQNVRQDEMDPESAKSWAKGVERLRREADDAANAVAQHIDEAQPFRGDGWFTAKRWLKHHLELSGPEAHARVQAARFRSRVPMWSSALSAGQVGTAHYRVMAAIAANPRIDDDTLLWGARMLLIDAMGMPFDDFEKLARTWEMLADPVSAAERAERNRQRRDATIRPRPDGGWDLHAVLDDISGAEFQQILAWYIDAEFRTDWTDAIERLGDGNVTMSDLRRSEPQRRADALVSMARAAAAAPPNTKRPVPTVNVVIDAATCAAFADDQPLHPDRYHDIISRTDRGHRVHPNDIINTTLWALIRRVVIDTKGVVIDLGRRSRLFTGNAREAVKLLEPTCVWTGCDQPATWCHADHLEGWHHNRGPTKPSNGAPLCPRHNYLKEQGFTVTRDQHGNWHVHAPDGHEIL